MLSFARLATMACAVALIVPAQSSIDHEGAPTPAVPPSRDGGSSFGVEHTAPPSVADPTPDSARSADRPAATVQDPATREGYVAMLLINEVPFPGEGRYVSVADSKAGMLQILWVLHNRLNPPPRGYTQRQIAMVTTKDVIDIITAGGVRGQVDGFYRGEDGSPVTTARVQERLAHLTRVANKGAPGKFAELINYAKRLGEAYFSSGPDGENLFAELREIDGIRVTGSAYSWMTDEARFAPGGNYVRVPDANRGGLGGNRFFTLKELR